MAIWLIKTVVALQSSGGAANDAMGEDEDDDDFIEPAANDESSSDHPRVAKEPDYGNTPPASLIATPAL